jgi:Mn2+/Fe2+ NRAMP family transporter
MYRILIGVGLIFAFGSVFLEQSPTILMVLSMAFQAAILPAVAIPIYFLLNRKDIMGNHKASLKMNIGLIAVIIFSLVTTYFALLDFF